jgi:transcriptional regulator with XRE-family HTH domain
MELGLSQERLGEEAGLHRTYIGAVERGEKNLTVLTLSKIARALKRAPAFFLE